MPPQVMGHQILLPRVLRLRLRKKIVPTRGAYTRLFEVGTNIDLSNHPDRKEIERESTYNGPP